MMRKPSNCLTQNQFDYGRKKVLEGWQDEVELAMAYAFSALFSLPDSSRS